MNALVTVNRNALPQPSSRPLAGLVLAMLALSTNLPGCGLQERWRLDSPKFHPTALDYWPQESAFLVGSYQDGTIQRVALNGIAASGPFLPKHVDGRQKALRVRIDGTRGRLWILDVDSLYAYALPDKTLLHRIELPGMAPSRDTCLPDMVVDPATGTVYVSNAAQPVIYVISEDAGAASLRIQDVLFRFEGEKKHDGGFSALLWIESPPALLAGSASTGRLWRVNPATGKAELVPLPRTVNLAGVCGMSLSGHAGPYSHLRSPKRLIYATTGFRNQIFRIQLSPDLSRGDAGGIGVAPLIAVEAPVSIVTFSSYVVVANSQLTRHPDFGGTGGPFRPYHLVFLPMSIESALITNR